MSNRSKAGGAGAPGRRGGAAALPALLLAAAVVVTCGDARAERFVLKSGEVVDGSIIQATRNTVIIGRSIGGMRQLPIQEIGEVRLDLARGEQVVGQFLGWADGVYELRAGADVVRVSESGILSREPGQQSARMLATRPRRAQETTAAATPSPAPAEQRAEPAPAAGPAENRTRSAAAARSDGAAAADDAERQEREAEARTAAARESQPGDTEARAAAVQDSLTATARQSHAGGETESQAAAMVEDEAAAERPSQPVADPQAPADTEPEAAADRQNQAAADEEVAALSEEGILAVKASVDPPEPGARAMVFNIELSEPAEQTVVLIYGTVDGTAKAGEDYEAQQGMVTVAPGASTAEVRVPLLEGAPEDGEKRFELVLMADPKVAEVVDRRVIATIKRAD
jgi:Calx-beta domain